MKTIPQTNPKAGYLELKREIDAAVARVLEGGWYIHGAEHAAFEAEFAAWLGADYAVGVGNGTDAIELALRALGVGIGDLVFTVSHTAVASVAAVELVGATPVLVDVDPETYTMSPESLLAALAHAPVGVPKVVMPVHLYGHPADMPAILEIAAGRGLRVLEDCAQAHGATLAGRKAGTFGDIATFSFYPTKNLGALGDGGMVATSSAELAERVKILREYGWRSRYISDEPGCNSRLDELQAAILRVKLRYLDGDNGRRRERAADYAAALGDLDSLELPIERPGAGHVYHQYVIRYPRRDDLAAKLKDDGVGTGIHYPAPVHLQAAYRGRLPLPVPLTHTERLAAEILSLPMFPQLSADDAALVAAAIRRHAG